MEKIVVYLAGPINGCNDDEAKSWRERVIELAGTEEFEFLDPMRRDYRGTEEGNEEAIVNGDLEDIVNCDVVLANCWKPSFGTAMEIYHSYLDGAPPIVISPPNQKVSPWLVVHSSAIVNSIEDAVIVLKEFRRQILEDFERSQQDILSQIPDEDFDKNGIN
jgi:nucleoside 2-deoxyribosyltransferase